jgi:hypothetical protein
MMFILMLSMKYQINIRKENVKKELPMGKNWLVESPAIV